VAAIANNDIRKVVTTMKKLFRGTSRKVLLSIGAVLVGASLAGMGTFASFTSTTSASQTVASGTVVIALGTAGSATNRLTINASGLVPGDTVQRAVDLSNTGNQNLATISLTTTAPTTSLLDSDPTNPLQMVVDHCNLPWTESGSSPAFTYACTGTGATTTTIIASRAIIGSALPMTGLGSLTSGGTDHLRVTLTLPTGAGNTLQGQTSIITYSFLGTQRAATNQ
jgi:spore coat-associated protein N